MGDGEEHGWRTVLVLNGNLHSRLLLDPTPARFKLEASVRVTEIVALGWLVTLTVCHQPSCPHAEGPRADSSLLHQAHSTLRQ
jgi:hypothetical protein